QRYKLYRKAVLASASIPLAVDPVQIDGNLYVDGGVRAQLFFEKSLFPGIRQLKKSEPNLDLKFHVIVNGKLCTDELRGAPTGLAGIGERVLSLLLDANEVGNLYQLEYLIDTNKFGKFRL